MHNIQEIIGKLSSLRVCELQQILDHFGYTNRYQPKAVLQSRVRDDLLNNAGISKAVCAMIVRLHANRTQTRGRMNPTTSANRRQTSVIWDYSTLASNLIQPPADVNRTAPVSCRQPAVTSHQSNDAGRVKLVDLPFYDCEATLLSASPLVNGSSHGVQTNSFRFTIPEIYRAKMAQCSKNPLPRYEVQLRMGLLDSSKDQQDAFPKNVRANINGSVVVFPPLINLPPRPGQVQPVQKREPLPVDVSSQCLPICDSYQLNVDWQHEKTNYFVAVYVVKHLTTENLLDRVQKSGRVHYEETLRMVRKSLRTSGEDDIAMDSLKVSLLCPLSRLVMSVPSRSRDCVHLQCFDLHSLLMMNEKRPTWKCPVCNKSSPYSSLVIDRYFSNIIAKVNGAAKDIELLPNGDFKIAGVKERQYHNVQESTVQVQQTNKSVGKKSPAYSNSSTRSATNEQWTTRRSSTPNHSRTSNLSPPDIITLDDDLTMSKTNSRPSLEIITLDDSSSSETESEGDKISVKAINSSAPLTNMFNGTRKRTHTQCFASSVPDVITLDSDSEDELPHRKSSSTTNTETTDVLSLQQKPEVKQPETNIFDAQSMAECVSASEFAFELYNFLKQFETNDLPQNE